MNFFEWLFGSAAFVPHGVCLLWRPDLVALHAVSDVIIAGAYFAIPAAIWTFVRLRTDLTQEHRRIAVLFSAFILWCGLTHLAGLATLWAPYYGAQGLIKAGTATVSLVTAFAVWPLLPKLLQLPSPAQLEGVNAELRTALAELEAVKADLERQVAERTEDLRILNARFERALDGSQITLAELDESLRYTWLYNPQLPLRVPSVVGATIHDLIDGEIARRVDAAHREALRTGEPKRLELATVADGETRTFVTTVSPAQLRNGSPGLLSVSVDVTAQVRQQEHMRVVLRELNHRTKNLLSVIQAIARQSGLGAVDKADFLDRLNARLQALASSHDVLVASEWSGADLRLLVERQLEGELQDRPDRVAITGEPVALAPKVAHYVGLALHELHTNAVKYGALSGDAGEVTVAWETEGEHVRLSWTERGGPKPRAPERRGFGRILLEEVVPSAAQGRAELRFDPEGLEWKLEGAFAAVQEDGSDPTDLGLAAG